MPYYDRIDISKGIDIAKRNNSKECIICLYWFFNHGFRFEDYVGNGCQDLLCLNISDIAIIAINKVNYRCIMDNINISEAIHSLEKSVLEDRGYL